MKFVIDWMAMCGFIIMILGALMVETMMIRGAIVIVIGCIMSLPAIIKERKNVR